VYTTSKLEQLPCLQAERLGNERAQSRRTPISSGQDTISIVMTEPEQDTEYNLDASTFQKPLGQLAEVLAQKVKREVPPLLRAPDFVAVDLHVLIRQAMYTYDLVFYVNADERRQTDCYWRPVYTMVTLPLIRNMIDCLYNITAILQDPPVNGSWFRKSGFKNALAALEEDEKRYGSQPKWDDWIQRNREGLDLGIRVSGLTMAEVLAQANPWPTLGKYISDKRPGGTHTPHQHFLKTFTYGRWREYSAMAHGAYEGLVPTAMYYIADSMPHEVRPKLDTIYPKILSLHIVRAAAILLCIVTELQAHFRFDDAGAHINQRIHPCHVERSNAGLRGQRALQRAL
jgi:hypothetical protein